MRETDNKKRARSSKRTPLSVCGSGFPEPIFKLEHARYHSSGPHGLPSATLFRLRLETKETASATTKTSLPISRELCKRYGEFLSSARARRPRGHCAGAPPARAGAVRARAAARAVRAAGRQQRHLLNVSASLEALEHRGHQKLGDLEMPAKLLRRDAGTSFDFGAKRLQRQLSHGQESEVFVEKVIL